jgi:hypothetical protein
MLDGDPAHRYLDCLPCVLALGKQLTMTKPFTYRL